MSIILPASFVNMSEWWQMTAYTWLLVTGLPSLRMCSLSLLMLSAIWSVVIPPLCLTIVYTIASSIFISYMACQLSITSLRSVRLLRKVVNSQLSIVNSQLASGWPPPSGGGGPSLCHGIVCQFVRSWQD